MSAFGMQNPGHWIGVALSRTELVAYDARLRNAGGPAWRMPLDAPAADNPVWPSLATALRTLINLTGETRASLAVALMPSVAETRRVEVPPLSQDELELVLARNAARYFVSAQGPQLVAVADGERDDKPGIVSASAPAWIIRLVSGAARDAGCTLEHIAPAEAAWSAAIGRAWPQAASGDLVVLLHQTDNTHSLSLQNGVLTGVRRFRSAVADAAVFAETLTPSAQVHSIGDAAVRKEWTAALGARSLPVSHSVNMPMDVAGDPALLAAAAVADVESLVFRTEEMRAADRKRRARAVYAVFVAAVVVLGTGAGFRLWDVKRELAAVQTERTLLRPQLARTVLGRASVETVSGQLQTLASAERSSAVWSAVIADITAHLPDEAYLTAFRGWSDSVRFEGLAVRASTVFPPLSRAESFVGIKAAAAVRLEAQVDGSSLEKFTLVAKLKPRVPGGGASDGVPPARAAARSGS